MAACYSETKKLAFIHIPRCGGHSVEAYLRGCIFDITKRSLTHRHHDMTSICYHTNTDLADWQHVICVIRNPYALQVSRWAYWRQQFAEGQSYAHAQLAASLPFTDWVLHRDSHHGPDEYHQWWQVDGREPDGLHIIKIEQLAQDLPQLCANFCEHDLPTLKQLNAAEHTDWQRYYTTQASIDNIKARYQQSLDRFYQGASVTT